MSKDISDTAVIELAPTSISGDAQVRAIAEAAQPHIDGITALVPTIEIYAHLDDLPDGLLHMLAWENRMGGAEWGLARTHQERVALVRNSYELNKRRGTRWSLYKVFDLLRFHPQIVEWWEESPEGDPYSFRITVLDVSERGGLSGDEIGLIYQLVDTYKPLRAWMADLNIQLETNGGARVLGGITFNGILDVMPMPPEEVTVDFEYGVKAMGAITTEGVLNITPAPADDAEIGTAAVNYGVAAHVSIRIEGST